MKSWRVGCAGLLVALLTACGGGGSGGDIGGTVSLAFGTTSDSLSTQIPQKFESLNGEFVPGEVIVRFKPSVSLQSVQSLQVMGVQVQQVHPMGLADTALYRAALGASDTLALVQALRQRSDVLYAHPNYILKALATPNDTFYPLLWHYSAMNLPAAWDIETGTSNPVTVAVIDTGILSQHPDFAGKILQGYDFITNLNVANDGNGRDANAEDVGDEPTGQSSYHGSHVAGTIAAATNNAKGIAGVSWGAKIVPARVLGVGGGSLADIVDAILWSAGVSVPGVPPNANPAQVLNLSLGGKFTCDQAQAYQDAFNQVAAKGAIAVVAAGNSHDNASLYSPASCSGVITVGATETRNYRSYYSNYGPRIDVMAPGGDTSVGTINKVCGPNGDQFCPDGVLSTIKNDTSGEFVYDFYQGTSMASPHIAGLVALMKSKKPSLTPAEALDVLKRTAKPLSGTACTGKPSAALDQVAPSFPTLSGSDCGAGLVDAQAALQALGGGTPTPDFTLSLNPNSLTLNPSSTATVSVNISRSSFTNAVSLSLSGAPTGVSGSFSPNSTTGNTSTLSLTISASTAPGAYSLTITGNGGSLTRTASLSLLVQSAGGGGTTPTLGGTVIAGCYAIIVGGALDCDTNKSKTVQLGNLVGKSASYKLSGLSAGDYIILGWKDVNGSKEVDNGDYLGAYIENGDLSLVKPGNLNANFEMDVIQSTGAASIRGRKLSPNALSLLR